MVPSPPEPAPPPWRWAAAADGDASAAEARIRAAMAEKEIPRRSITKKSPNIRSRIVTNRPAWREHQDRASIGQTRDLTQLATHSSFAHGRKKSHRIYSSLQKNADEHGGHRPSCLQHSTP